MDNHLWYSVWDYAECELIPRFNAELQSQVDVRGCYVIEEAPSYREIKDLCKALNAIAPYAGMNMTTPSDLVTLSWELNFKYQ